MPRYFRALNYLIAAIHLGEPAAAANWVAPAAGNPPCAFHLFKMTCDIFRADLNNCTFAVAKFLNTIIPAYYIYNKVSIAFCQVIYHTKVSRRGLSLSYPAVVGGNGAADFLCSFI